METLFNLLPIHTAFADSAPTLSSSLFSTITIGANTFVSIVKWAALLWLLVRITVLGFNIITEAKNSSDAFTKIKEQGGALLIGFFIVMTAFLIHTALKDTVNSIGNAGKGSSESIEYHDKNDVFNN